MPFREAVRAWFAISLRTFGGPAGQIAGMRRVESRDVVYDGPALSVAS